MDETNRKMVQTFGETIFGKQLLQKPILRFEDNINMELKVILIL